MTEPNDNPAVYVYALMIAAVITVTGQYSLTHSQFHPVSEAQFNRLVSEARYHYMLYNGNYPEDTQQYTMR